MISILALVEDERAASCRFRIRQFVEPLAGEGIDLKVRGLDRDRTQRLKEAAGFPAVILHRKLLRPGEFRLLRRSARRLIYDFDDAVMFRDSNAPRQGSRQRHSRFRRLVSGADLVLAGNEYLGRLAAAAGGRPVIFPTVVNVASFPPRPPGGEGGEVVGWMGSASNFVYLRELANPIRSLLAPRPGLIFRVVADRPPELDGLPADYRPWSEDREAAELYGFSVGVMPLLDDPWTRGKCAFKLLLYGAASLPAVASPVGANRDVIQEGVTGYFARNPEEWLRRLEELLASPARREEMGRAARRLVEERYSLAAAVPRLAGVIRRIAGE